MTSAQEHNRPTFAVGTPTAAEMAAAEAELQAIGSVEPLPEATIEQLLRGPFAATAVARPRPPIARMVALAAILLLAISGIAWAGMRVVWPVQQNSVTTLPLADAIVLATEPNRDDSARRAAIVVMFERAFHGADAIVAALKDADPDVAATARSVQRELLQRLQQSPTTPPVPLETDVVVLAAQAQDRTSEPAARAKALGGIRELITNCIDAAIIARFDTADGESFRTASLDMLRELLTR